MEVTMSIKKEQFSELLGQSFPQGQFKAIRVRTIDGKVIDFEELIILLDAPIAVKK